MHLLIKVLDFGNGRVGSIALILLPMMLCRLTNISKSDHVRFGKDILVGKIFEKQDPSPLLVVVGNYLKVLVGIIKKS